MAFYISFSLIANKKNHDIAKALPRKVAIFTQKFRRKCNLCSLELVNLRAFMLGIAESLQKAKIALALTINDVS